jgi:V8-like Glu-specific endopeptidase
MINGMAVRRTQCGSGVVISPNLFLTAAHNVYNRS